MSGAAAIEVLADAVAVAEAAAARFANIVRAAVATRGVAHVALTGGSTAPPLLAWLATHDAATAVEWPAVQLWWGDERFVPLDHPASNAGVALDVLGDRLRVPVANIHPWPVAEAIGRDEGPAEAAAAYAANVQATMPLDAGGDPIFDLLLLGVGPDGHVLSCFPGSPGLAPDAPLALGVAAPADVAPHVPRVTFRARVIPAARAVLVLAPGAGKAAALVRVLEGPLDVAALPAQAARIPQATWLLDRAAASSLAPRAGEGPPAANPVPESRSTPGG